MSTTPEVPGSAEPEQNAAQTTGGTTPVEPAAASEHPAAPEHPTQPLPPAHVTQPLPPTSATQPLPTAQQPSGAQPAPGGPHRTNCGSRWPAWSRSRRSPSRCTRAPTPSSRWSAV